MPRRPTLRLKHIPEELRRQRFVSCQKELYSSFVSQCPSVSYTPHKFDILFKGEPRNALQHIAQQLSLTRKDYVFAAYTHGASPAAVPRDLPLSDVGASVSRAFTSAQQVHDTESHLPRWTTSRSRFLKEAFSCIRQQLRDFKALVVSTGLSRPAFWKGERVCELYYRLRQLRAVLKASERRAEA